MSVYNVILPTPIPDKGAILTQLWLWWFGQIADLVPNHVISEDVPGRVLWLGDPVPEGEDRPQSSASLVATWPASG